MDIGKRYTTERVPLDRYAEQLSNALALDGLTPAQLCGLGEADLLTIPAGVIFHDPQEGERAFWILLEGEVAADKAQPDGTKQRAYIARTGDSFGEVTLLAGKAPSLYLEAVQPVVGLRFDEDSFWRLMACSVPIRQMILTNMSQRLQIHMAEAAHREKLISLGTLAAGLMHELHNPGAAAKRSASQLRTNLLRLQEMSLRNTGKQKTPVQMECMHELLIHAFRSCHAPALSSLDQADAEEAMSEWLDTAGVENAFTIGPALVSIGFDKRELECAREVFDSSSLSDALNWLEALVSSMQLVGTIEESIGRVTELVAAVKSYAYEGRGQKQSIDVNRSILATLIIVGHKLREKQIVIEKDLAKDLPLLNTDCQGINQIWTNLLDNAIDAAPQGGRICLKTWAEQHDNQTALFILVSDNGSGIPLESQPRIFDPFYTTKPVGVGTGLGLGIVHRIVEQFGGSIRFTSVPGETEFVVRLPNGPA
jgi:signal transduction histidine kinase